MHIRATPDPIEKLAQVGDANRFEPVGDRPEAEQAPAPRVMPAQGRDIPVEVEGVMSCITEVSTPRGKKPVLKAMVTTACEKNCHYCPFRAGRGAMRRVTFKPDEMARAFDQIRRAGLVDGIFLSSGIVRGGAATQDTVIDTIEIIRRRYEYRGYVHLKIMPGAEYDQIRRAMELADRVSVNLEGPTPARLRALAPKKDFEGELLERLRWAHEIRQRARDGRPGSRQASLVTQFVVGAVGDTDLELLSVSERLYRQMGLWRAYYSAFNPIEGTPFETLDPTPPLRQHRLYQASFLLRDYGWDVEDMPFEQGGNLRLGVDPKRAWADDHLREQPVEVMHADRLELMRVPGIGPKGARAIIRARRKGRLSDLSHLRAVGVRAPEQAAPYILLDGLRPPQQLPLFDRDEGRI
jgi:predicted DNA-binding helix-hairpin-helix protein